jgi:hypothetical protein
MQRLFEGEIHGGRGNWRWFDKDLVGLFFLGYLIVLNPYLFKLGRYLVNNAIRGFA